MKRRKGKKLALLLILAMIFQGFPNFVPGSFSVEMGEFIENVAAADPEEQDTLSIENVFGAKWVEDYYLADSDGENSGKITFQTNAISATNLRWAIYRNKQAETNELPIPNNDYMTVDINDIGNEVTLSNIAAGVYYLVAEPAEQSNNEKVNNLIIKLIVPLMISDKIIMNVGDTYDVLSNTNIPKGGGFSYVITDQNGFDVSDVDRLAKISDGVLTALQGGEGHFVIRYNRNGNDTFPEAEIEAGLFKEEYSIPLTVYNNDDDKLSITAETNTNTMYLGDNLSLTLNSNYFAGTVVWSSEDESILTVAAKENNAKEAVVTAKAPGKADVTVKQTVDGVTKSATYTITVMRVTVELQSLVMNIGSQQTITATVSPKEEASNVSLLWVTSDESIVSLQDNGLSAVLKAVKEGTAVITVTDQQGKEFGSYEVTVRQPITSIRLSETEVTILLANKSLQLQATILPEEAKNEELIWESTDTSIITVEQDGLITLNKAGTASIICSSKKDSNISAICNVTVIDSLDSVKIEATGVKWNEKEAYYLANSDNITFQTNPDIADSLEWKFYRCTGTKREEILDDQYITVDSGKRIELSGMTAGVYELEAIPVDRSLTRADAEKLVIKVVVPLKISEEEINLNENEIYDLFSNTNIPDRSQFNSYDIIYRNGNAAADTLASILEGVMTALSGGKGYVLFQYNGSEQDFPGIAQNDEVYKPEYRIPFTVMEESTNRPWPADSNISFYMTYNSRVVEDGEIIEMTANTATIGVGNTSGIWPSDAWIEWKIGNRNVVQIEESPDSKYMGIATAVGPGYTDLQPIIHYDGIEYPLPSRQIHVPLSLVTTSKENRVNFAYNNWYGMIDQLAAGETVDTKTIQLSTKESAEHPTHYLPIFKYVNYAQGINSVSNVNGTPASVFADGVRMNEVWEWFSSDETVVKVDAETGFITAVGAGYATVTVQTKTTDAKGGKDAKTFGILVTPAIDSVSGAGWKEEGEYYLADSLNITFLTNAQIASNLEWALYRNDRKEVNKLDIVKNDYLTADISNIGNGVSFSHVAAGVYYLVARPTDKYSLTNTKVNNLIVKIIVPLMISEDEIFMNVDDQYDLRLNSNIPEKGMFSYEITDRNGNPTTALNPLAEISNGILTALQIGEGYLVIHYRGGDKDVFQDAGVDAALLYKEEYRIPLTVIDRLVITAETNTMYVGSTLPLVLSPGYNKNASITWSSSDTSVLTVAPDEDNASKAAVTAKAPGIAVVTASQTVNGVTKSATYTITVLPAITGITLEPKSLIMEIGDQQTIKATVSPKVDTTNVSLHWVTSDSSIVSVEGNGLSAVVKAIKGGTAVITAINQQNIVVASCLVTVKQPITSIRLSQTKVTIPLSSKSFQLQATILPEAARNEGIIWKSTDTSIITVDQYGLVTLRKAGSASIICSSVANGNISAICNVTVTKSVTGIKLDQTALNLAVGESYRLTYEVNPADAANIAVTWTSTNGSVVTVDAKGLIRARSVGQAVIILKTVDGGYMATCVVTVSQAATGVKLDVNALTLNVGDYYNLEAIITPANSTDVSLSWESSDKKVAIVSNKGKVTAKSPGVSIILVRTKNGASAYCTVTVQQGVTSVKLDTHEETIYVGDEISLDATVSPKSATMTDVKWSSSKNAVARVNADGEVTGVSAGVAIITCTTVDGGYTDYCVIIVERPEVEVSEITVDPEEYMLGVGESYRLTATVTPDNATNREVIWSSSDTDIVTVDKKGRIKGIAPGTATITCEAADGSGEEAYCEVEVYTQITDISLNYNYLDMVVGDSATLTAAVNPANATYGIYWESEDPSIAVVNRTTGTVIAVKAGDTKIVAKADDNTGTTSVCVVHVKNPIATTNIQVSESEVVMIPGETKSVSFTILPAGHTDGYVWSSDNPVVASVDARTGLITAHSMGSANITIFADSGRSASVKVYVVGLSKTTLTLQQYTSTIISLEVFGASNADLDVRWYSENERIAEVANGKITGRALGTTYVYAVVNGRNLACRVTVEKIRNN